MLQEFNNLLRNTQTEPTVTYYDGVTDQGVAMMVRTARFVPFNPNEIVISLFLTGPYSGYRPANQKQDISQDEWEIALQNNNTLPLAEVRLLLKVTPRVARSFEDGVRQLQNWHYLMTGLFGWDSTPAYTANAIVSELLKRTPTMKDAIKQYPMLIPGLLQTVHNLFLDFFNECSYTQPTQRPPGIDLTRILQQISSKDTFGNVQLDLNTQMALRNQHPAQRDQYNPKDNQNQKRDRTDDTQENKSKRKITDKSDKSHLTDKSHPGHNQNFDKTLESTAFSKEHVGEIPLMKGTNTALCFNYHLRGGCRFGKTCPRAASHRALAPETMKLLRIWAQQK